MAIIFKICRKTEWAEAEAAGVYQGSADDRRDGFIHFSTPLQLGATLTRHFAGQDDLILIAVEADSFGEALRWEEARNGDLFPHLYAPLPVSAALWTSPLPIGESGLHILPSEARP